MGEFGNDKVQCAWLITNTKLLRTIDMLADTWIICMNCFIEFRKRRHSYRE